MKRFLKWSGISAFAALLPLLMAPTGGIPSILTLQKLTVTATTGKACPSASNTGVVCVANNSSTGHVTWSQVVETRGAAGNQLGLLVASTAAGNSTDSIFRVSNNGTSVFNIDGTGAVTGPGGALVPRTVYANITLSGATCAVGTNSGVTGCSHTGTGQYSLTVTGLSVAPVCTVSTTGAMTPLSVNGSTSSSVIVSSFNTSFASADVSSTANVICDQ